MNEIAFGRYTPYNTFVHRIDPRTKIFMMLLLFVSFCFLINVPLYCDAHF